MFKKIFFCLTASFLLFFFWPPASVLAAGSSLYFSPSAGAQSVGSKFSLAVKLNTNDQNINAGQGVISFDNNLLKVVGVSKNSSIFAFWTEEPSFSNASGKIEFGGGIPRPGYVGNGGSVFSITFEALRAGTAEINFISGSVLANDGKGTNVLTGMGGASFSVNPSLLPSADGKITESENPQEQTSRLQPAVSSETNPDPEKWYRDRQIKLKWPMPAGIEGVSVAFDKNPNTDPGDTSDGVFDSKEYIAESDGTWYFHIKFKDKKGWGTIAHHPIRIDTAPPEPFEAWSKQEDPNDWPTIFFKTIDKLSGLIKYSLVVNSLKSEPYIVSSDKDSLKVSDLEVGQHSIMVRAIDEAGNETFSTINFEIKSILEPKVENCSVELSSEDKFFVSGTALPEATIKLSLKKEGSDKVEDYQAMSDKNGNWSFVLPQQLANGRYVFWTQAINANGLSSRPSTALSFLVTPPVFARIGSFVINYFTVFASLLFVVVLIIFLSVLTAKVLRRRLKKETYEIEEVLEKNLETLKSALASEASALVRISKDRAVISKSGAKSDLSREVIALKQRLDEKIGETGRRIMKEIKDVEKILK